MRFSVKDAFDRKRQGLSTAQEQPPDDNTITETTDTSDGNDIPLWTQDQNPQPEEPMFAGGYYRKCFPFTPLVSFSMVFFRFWSNTHLTGQEDGGQCQVKCSNT
jgi:hypothetical protein